MKPIQLVVAIVTGVALLGTGCSQTTAKGPRGEKLTLVKPVAQEIDRGDTEPLTVTIHRQNIADPIRLEVSQLPAGVEAIDIPRTTKDEKVEVLLRASPTADLVANHVVLVTAEGPNGTRVSETFELTVSQQDDQGD